MHCKILSILFCIRKRLFLNLYDILLEVAHCWLNVHLFNDIYEDKLLRFSVLGEKNIKKIVHLTMNKAAIAALKQ